MTTVARTTAEWQAARETAPAELGFVPTMGALHEGHLSLIRRSMQDNPATVVSIFVNPTQFNDPKDLESYPRPVEQDAARLEREGVDYIYLPTRDEIYFDDYRYRVTESELSRKLCGMHRPGHFDGVLTVCLRLFNLVKPRRAYFGEKDYQQLRLIQGMVRALFLDLEIVPCPIVREADGLAMSSRNLLLSPEARRRATEFPRALRDGATPEAARKELELLGFRVEYVEELEGRRLGAVAIDGVRLIDNVKLVRET